MDYQDLKNLRKRISKAKKIIGQKRKNVLKLKQIQENLLEEVWL